MPKATSDLPMKKLILSKSARLVLLLRLRDAGALEDQTLRTVGDILGVDRSTILRDLRVLDQVEEEYSRLMATQPWIKREYTVPEFAGEIGASSETVRGMIRDGLVEARKRPATRRGRWHVSLEEVQRWKRWKEGE